MRYKRFILNFLSDFLPQIIILVLSVFKMSIMLTGLGEDQFGVYQLFSQIIAYLVLIEGGVGSATLFRLYKPIHNKDKEAVQTIIRTSRYLFRFICAIIIGLGLLLSFIVPLLIKETVLDLGYIQISFVLYLFSQASYYFTVTERAVFDAYQRRYIPNLIFQAVNILKVIAEIVVVSMGGGLLEVILSLLVIGLLANILLKIIYRLYYGKVDIKDKKDFTVLKDIKHLAVNTVGNLVTNNIDIIILSKIVGIGSVVIYSAYNFVISNIKGLLEKIVGAIMSPIGSIVLDGKEKSHSIYCEFSSAMSFLSILICAPLFFSLNYFITIIYGGQVFTSLAIAFCFCFLLYCELNRMVLKVFTLSSGFFKYVKNFVILESVTNLITSLILVNYLGIMGVLIGTIFSIIFADFIPKAIVVHKKIFKTKPNKFFASSFINFLIFIALLLLTTLFQPDVPNILAWFLYSVFIFIINAVILLIIFRVKNDLKFLKRIKFLEKIIR